MIGDLSEVGRLERVLVKHARDAFISQDVIDRQWRELRFSARPDYGRAIDEYEAFLDILRRAGCETVCLPADERVTLDSMYTRDASVLCARGVVLGAMGKPERASEPSVQGDQLLRLNATVAGRITAPACLEGGDVVWLDSNTIAVGCGYRTNDAGIQQLRTILGETAHLIVVPLPHWRGPSDVMHLMSLMSPVDANLAVVYSPLLPVPFRETLLRRGYRFVDVPDREFDTMGTNVLALAPRVCVMVKGNPLTRAALESAGVSVFEYEGQEISLKGGGGPTCLTRPLMRVRN